MQGVPWHKCARHVTQLEHLQQPQDRASPDILQQFAGRCKDLSMQNDRKNGECICWLSCLRTASAVHLEVECMHAGVIAVVELAPAQGALLCWMQDAGGAGQARAAHYLISLIPACRVNEEKEEHEPARVYLQLLFISSRHQQTLKICECRMLEEQDKHGLPKLEQLPATDSAASADTLIVTPTTAAAEPAAAPQSSIAPPDADLHTAAGSIEDAAGALGSDEAAEVAAALASGRLLTPSAAGEILSANVCLIVSHVATALSLPLAITIPPHWPASVADKFEVGLCVASCCQSEM